jgi:hypothetical protein
MAVPYIFASVPAGTTIPLAEIDANFAYLAYSPTITNLSVTGTLSVGQDFISNGPAIFNNGLAFIGSLGVNGSYVTPTGTTGAGNLVLSANPTLVSPNLGQPTYGNLSLCSGYSVHNLVGCGANVIQFLSNPTSSNLENAVIDCTGGGKLVFNQDPVLIGPVLQEPQLNTVASGNLQNCIGYQGVNISGIVPIAHGGTGLSSVGNLKEILQVTTAGTLGYAPMPPTANVLGGAPSQLLYQVNTNVTGFLPNGTANQVLVSTGTLAPTWKLIDLTQSITNVLPVINGGTGSTTAQSAINTLVGGITANYVVKGNGSNIVLAPLNATDISLAGTLSNNTTGSSQTFTSTNQNSQFNSIGVNTSANGVTGNVDATGFFTDGTGTLHPIITIPARTAVGTDISWTFNIPSWATRITMNFNAVTYTATPINDWAIQLGSNGVYVTAGYNGFGQISGIRSNASTNGLIIIAGTSACPMTGSIIFNNLTGNTWVGSGMLIWLPPSPPYISFTASTIAMPGVVDSIRLTTINGTDIFNGGQVNIQYE